MQKIIIEKPYRFVPPHHGNLWPSFIQRFRLIDYYLKRFHGIASYEVRNEQRLADSIASGHGILLTPNHSRPADPIAMGWLARAVGTHVFAMASWHLFHQDWLTGFAIRKMGGFSVYREGLDRKAIDTAIDVLTHGTRPLILFPEGAVTRTNDKLSALLDGVAFIARTAAKRRKKLDANKQVVIHPVAIKYLFRGNLFDTLSPVLTEIEHRLSWHPKHELPLMERIRTVGYALLSLKEIEYFGSAQQGRLSERLPALIDRLLQPLEMEWLGEAKSGAVVPRIKALRMKIVPDLVQGEISEDERARRWRQLADLYLSQQVFSYPPDYISDTPTVERLLETVERYEEDLTDEVRVHGDLHAILEVGEPIVVEAGRNRSELGEPLTREIECRLQSMLDHLASESAVWCEASTPSPSASAV